MPQCDSMTYIGKYAGDHQGDAEDYLITCGLLKVGELEDKYGGDIQYMFQMGFPLNVQCENYFSGRGYYVGFEVDPSDYKSFDSLLAEFKQLTGDEGEVIQFEQYN